MTDPTDGVAENALGVTGMATPPDDWLAQPKSSPTVNGLRAPEGTASLSLEGQTVIFSDANGDEISRGESCHQPDESVPYNVSTNLQADPLADKFEVESYSDGGCDVSGSHFYVSWFTNTDPGMVVVFRNPTTSEPRGKRMGMARAAALELRDALDVLLQATRKPQGEST